ncbi:MAG: NAD(P)H-dependent oxidoreductase [Chlorobi bacterium]|nr:NAD(P)H-dependent oxidoreductase [Chlorobiota bacterium]MCI0716809.1 NAD(P)H-dependent oxidoreductase [Chlorobiota bacterium]
MQRKIRIMGIGGSLEAHSSTLAILKYEMMLIKSLGAQIKIINLRNIKLPLYNNSSVLKGKIKDMLNEIHTAEGYIFASPEYHGTVSASFKNIIDYFEFLAGYTPPYITGKPVGCIAAAGAENAGATTLQTMFNIVHNLRGISASNSFAIGSASTMIGRKGELKNEHVKRKLKRLAEEVYNLALKLK